MAWYVWVELLSVSLAWFCAYEQFLSFSFCAKMRRLNIGRIHRRTPRGYPSKMVVLTNVRNITGPLPWMGLVTISSGQGQPVLFFLGDRRGWRKLSWVRPLRQRVICWVVGRWHMAKAGPALIRQSKFIPSAGADLSSGPQKLFVGRSLPKTLQSSRQCWPCFVEDHCLLFLWRGANVRRICPGGLPADMFSEETVLISFGTRFPASVVVANHRRLRPIVAVEQPFAFSLMFLFDAVTKYFLTLGAGPCVSDSVRDVATAGFFFRHIPQQGCEMVWKSCPDGVWVFTGIWLR